MGAFFMNPAFFECSICAWWRKHCGSLALKFSSSTSSNEPMETEDFNLFHGLYSDPIHLILSFSSFGDLCIQSTVSSEWHESILSNNALWSALCKSYWAEKYGTTHQLPLSLNIHATIKQSQSSTSCC